MPRSWKPVKLTVHVWRHGRKQREGLSPEGVKGDVLYEDSIERLSKKGEALGKKLMHFWPEKHAVIGLTSGLYRTRQTRDAVFAGLRKSGFKNILAMGDIHPTMKELPMDWEIFNKILAERASTPEEKSRASNQIVLDYIKGNGNPAHLPELDEVKKGLEKTFFGGIYRIAYSPEAKSKKRAFDYYHVMNFTHNPNATVLLAMIREKAGLELGLKHILSEEARIDMRAEKDGLYYKDYWTGKKHMVYSLEEMEKKFGKKGV